VILDKLKKIDREFCYICYRPKSSCMCKYISKIDTNTKFVILMHPKEFRKTKNRTGHFTNLSLINSEIHIGIDFSCNGKINKMINDPENNCFVLYPSKDSIELNTQKLDTNGKKSVIFIIDSTWACSKKMIRLSKNLNSLPKISFQYSKESNYKIKTQPSKFCLSTIESVFCVLKLLNEQKIENISPKEFDNFLKPFIKMVEYQIDCANRSNIRNKRIVNNGML